MNNAKRLTLPVMALLVVLSAAARSEGIQSTVIVNGRSMSAEQIQEFVAIYGQPPAAGTYWYDPRSGLYGYVGGTAIGSMRPGHDYGPLAADASSGATGIFLNGRRLPTIELQIYAQILGSIPAGRYWLEANGNVGREGESQALGNLIGAVAESNADPGTSAQPTPPGAEAPGASNNLRYTDSEGYTWERHLFDCQLQQGDAALVLDVSYIQDVGLTWDKTKRPTPEISGVIGLDQQIRYMKGEFRVGGESHRFTGRGDHFSFRETLDNSQTGRFELRGSTLAVFYPFDNPTPGFCNPSNR